MILGIFSGVGEVINEGTENLIEGFNRIISFIENIFKGVNKAIPYISDMIDMLIDIINTMPSWLRSIALLSITISVIYFFIGREQGGS